jgi:hypothetical protein
VQTTSLLRLRRKAAVRLVLERLTCCMFSSI